MIFVDNDRVLKKEYQDMGLDESTFSNYEIKIIKSLKIGEFARIEILPVYLKSSPENLLEMNKIRFSEFSRIYYEIKLIDFTEKIEKETKNGNKYTVMNLAKGLGNICAWRNSCVRIRIKILNKEKILYSSFEEDFDEIKISGDLNIIRKRIKSIPNHLKVINFLVDKNMREENIKTDLINLNFKLLPSQIYENIISMRPLEFRKISFKGIDYLKINDFELIDFNEDFTVYLNVFDFVNNDTFSVINDMEKLEEILKYKNIANELFKKGIFNKARSCYKYIVDEYEREINLKGKNVEIFSKDCVSEIKRVFYNLINCYFKLNRVLKSEEFIKKFIEYFGEKDEKILFLKLTLHKLKNEDEFSLQTAEKLYEFNSKEEYLIIINEFKEKIEKNKKMKANMYRKFIKNI